jgi:hypothetical protein
MRSILFSLSLIAALVATSSPASAEEPAPVRNRSGLFARDPALVVGWGPDGCANLRTNGAQFLSAEAASEMLAAAADARAQCVRAQAQAQAALTLAQAGATVAVTAAAQGRDTYVSTDGEVATGQAASYAAMQGTLGVPLGGWPSQAAADMAALQAVNGGGFLPPPPAPAHAQTRRPPPPGPTPAEVAAAEARARAAAGR